MEITSFKEMYFAELQELASAEKQLSELQSRMVEKVSNPALKDALTKHREETETHLKRLNSILEKHGESASEHIDQSMQSMVREAEKMIGMLKGDELRDAGLIASAQKLEHYEIAGYGTAAALAGQLDLREDQEILHQTLEEEKKTDALLTELAKRHVNPGAVTA